MVSILPLKNTRRMCEAKEIALVNAHLRGGIIDVTPKTAITQPSAGSRIQAGLQRWLKPSNTKAGTKLKNISIDTVHARRIAEALRQESFELTYNPQQWFYKAQLNTRKVTIAYSVILVIACALAGIAGSFAALLLSYL